MAHPTEEGGLHTEGKQRIHYKKVRGTAAIDGQTFEYKFCALAFIKAINEGLKFKLGCNVEGFGIFDDVVLEYLDDSGRTSYICMQLKWKARQTIKMEQLLNESGDFSLIKHYKSYVEIEKNLKCRKCVEINDESLFVIYTNADVEDRLKSDKSTESGQEKFLNTGGSVLQFNEEKHKEIYKYMKEKPRYREFLSRYRIMYRQANGKKMDGHIIPPLQEKLKLPDSEKESACRYFCDFVKDWWKNDKSSYFLQEKNHKDYDPLQKISEIVSTSVAKMLKQRKCELDELAIKYEESAIKNMTQQIEPHKAVLIFAPGQSTTLTAAKIHQTLSGTKHIMLNLQQLRLYKSEVMLAWKGIFKVMVLEGDRSPEDFEDVFNDVSVTLSELGAEKRFIFISSRMGTIQQKSTLRRIFRTKLTEVYDDWKFTDIVTESRMLFLEKKVYFQGAEIKLGDIVKENGVGTLNTLDTDSTFLLLGNEKLSIGSPIEDAVEYYIDRILQCRKNVKPCFQLQDQINPALSGDTLQEQQHTSSYREENSERETTRAWKPSTLLEGGDRVILVTDEPGMGKSTLLTHLAKETRQNHPDMWIVMININNHSSILEEMKTNGCDENGAIKLLTGAAKIKETEGSLLEGRLFHYTYSSTGNMAVIIDGVDEVSPHYTEEVLNILKILSLTEIKRIWVTSRNSVKSRLEEELKCQSYSLVPFDKEDQKYLLVKFWNKNCPNAKQKDLENLAKRVVELSMEHFDEGNTNFMGFPLHSMLLAEMFEENLKQCSTSTTVELPENVNLVKMYNLYVKRKWDIYLSEKKVSDQTNVSVLSENAQLHEHFIHHHMAAALVAILSTNHLQKLAGNTIAEKSRQFVQKIEEGVEKTGIITDVIEGRPVFQHRTLAEYFVARWLCENMLTSQTFMRDHFFETGLSALRGMVDRILADKYPLHEAVLNSNLPQVKTLLLKEGSVNEKDRGERTPLHIAVSYKNIEIIRLLLEHGADENSVDTLLGLSPLDYARTMDDWEMLSLVMEKRPDIREHVLNGANRDCMDHTASALRAAAKYGRNDLLQYLISKGNSVNMVLPGDNSTLLHVAARNQQTETVKILVLMGAGTDSQDVSGKTPLHVSVETGNLEVINSIVEIQKAMQRETEVKGTANFETATVEGNILNLGDIDGNTPLHLAAAAGNTSIVSYLVSAGSDLNARNIQGEYPLTVAARCGKNDIVDLFLKGDPCVKYEEAKIGALRAAVLTGHVDTTALLLSLGAPVSGRENEQPIHAASQMGHKEIVCLLLDYGASLKSRTNSGNTALHLASETGHMDLVKYLVEGKGDNVNSLNCENETPLHLAARNGRGHLVKYFVEKGCNINATSANGATSLHLACENGHYMTVEYLLKHGTEVNAINSAKQTPLHIAAGRGQTKIIELLSQHNANISSRDKDGITALLAASRNGHTDTVRFIVQHSGNIEDTDVKGNTIAHFAVANENKDILKLLSNHDANLDVLNSDGDTPLLKAVREGRNTIVHYLVEKNCNINTQGNDGNRPLDIAVLNGNVELTRLLLEREGFSGKPEMHIFAAARFGFLDILQHLLVMGDYINTKTEEAESPLHVACKYGQVDAVQYLSEHGALLDLQDSSGNTALHVAVSNGHLEVTRVLVGKGANLAVANASGSTALHIAALYGHANIVRFLADSFSPIDLRNAKKQTALLVAAAQGHEEIVRILIEQGAGLGVKDIEGKTALDIATEKDYVVITQLLKDRAEGNSPMCSTKNSELHNAAEGGNLDILHRTVNAGASTDKGKEKNGSDTPNVFKTTAEGKLEIHYTSRSALRTAALNGTLEEVQRLVKAGIALDYCDTFGRTALWVAASRGHKYIIRLLLENGSCTNIPDCEGVAPLYIAAREGQWDAVEELLIHDARVSPECAEYLHNQLHKASETGNLEVVRIILKCGISLDITNNCGCTPLHVAAKCGHKELVRILLENGANVNIAESSRKTPLMLAAENGHVGTVRVLLSTKAISDSFTALFSAATTGHLKMIRELLYHGACVNNASEDGLTPLSAAASEGHVAVVQELLNRGASLNIADEHGCTPLYAAALNGHVEVVRELLNRRAIAEIANRSGHTPLRAAVEKGHLEVVRLLLNHGADVGVADVERSTLLKVAAFYRHVEVVRELLNYGANVNTSNEEGSTLLNTAASEGHVEIVRVLLKHAANVDIADNCGRTPLNSAASKGQVKAVRVLLRHGANVDIADNCGRTPLNSAALKGQMTIVRVLLRHAASVDIADNCGRTPLNSAASEGQMGVVRVLLNHRACVDIADKDGRTALYAAVLNGHVEVVRELLNHHANVDTADKNGWTPLYAASLNGHVVVVRELLNHGASVDIANNDDLTPLKAAHSQGHVDVVLELKNHGASVVNAEEMMDTSQVSSC